MSTDFLQSVRAQGKGALLASAQREPRLLFPPDSGSTHNTALSSLTVAAKNGQTAQPTDDVDNGRKIIAPSADNWFYLSFLGDGSDNQTGGFIVWGWRRLSGQGRASDLWMPYELVRGEFVLAANAPGVAGALVDDGWFFADTITVSTDNTYSTPSATPINSSDGIARLFFDYEGMHLIEVQLTRNASGTDIDTAVNGLWWTI